MEADRVSGGAALASPVPAPWSLSLPGAAPWQRSPFLPVARHWRRLIVAGVTAYLVIVGCGGFLHPGTSSAWVFLALTLNLGLASVPILFYRRSFGWFHPLIFCFLLQLVQTYLPRTPLYVAGLANHRALPGWSIDDLTRLVAFELAIGAIGIAAYLVGFFCGVSPRPPRLRLHPPSGLHLKCGLIVIFSAVLFALYIAGKGGIGPHLVSWDEVGRSASVMGEGYIIKLTRLGATACLVWLAFDRSAIRQPLFWAAAVLSLAINFLGNGSRSAVLIVIVSGVVIWALRRGAMAIKPVLVVALICLFLVAVLGTFRRTTGERDLGWPAIDDLSVQGNLEGAVTEMAYRRGWRDSVYAVLANVPERVDLLYGRTYLGLAGAFVPRAIWPGKPETIGRLAGRTFFGVQAGTPPGAVGEAFWNFHIPGVCVVFLLFGIFHRWVVRSFLRYHEHPAAFVVLAMTLFFPQPNVGAAAEWVFAMGSLAMILFVLGVLRPGGRKRRSAATQSGHRRVA